MRPGIGGAYNSARPTNAMASLRRDEGRTDRADRLVAGRAGGIGGRRRSLRRGGGRGVCGGARGTLPGGCRSGFRRQWPRHLLRALFGDDDVALLLGGSLVVDALQRIGPGLAGRLAGAGRIELLAEAKRVGRRRIGLAVDRHRLVDVFAGVTIGVEVRLRRRAECLAGLFVVGETAGNGGKGDRKISAVAGADADGAEGAGVRAEIGAGCAWIVVVVAEQIIQKIARTARGVGVLRP